MAIWALWMVVALSAASGAAGETRYEKFLRQHVDYPRTSPLASHRYCETMLARQ
ncbi:RNL2 Ribonuclease, partial [Heliornis fulica]|nr:RNL2 Ribonuclease [Heliornis fulica]